MKKGLQALCYNAIYHNKRTDGLKNDMNLLIGKLFCKHFVKIQIIEKKS